MAGLFGISVKQGYDQADFLNELFHGTFYQQLQGEQYSGMSSYRPKRKNIEIKTHKGLFRPTFTGDMGGLEGTEAIGYCGPFREPYYFRSRQGESSICYSGNILNRPEIITDFLNFGHTLEREDDIEIMAKMLAQGNGITDGIVRITQGIQGSVSLMYLHESGIWATTYPGHWPLVVGQKSGAMAIASDSAGFSNLGFEIVRDLEPGEIVCLKDGQLHSVLMNTPAKPQFCSFWWVYTGFASSVFRSIPASLVRKMLGAALAQRDIAAGFIPDVVIPVPDSGRFHAIGYKREFDRQFMEGKIDRVPFYDEGLLKYPYSGRSFTPQTQEERDKEATVKILVSSELYEGKILVACDDSVVRGTQTKNSLVPKMKSLGVKEVHLRISNPELRSYCPFGKTTKNDELFALRFPDNADKAKKLGVDGIGYNRLEDLRTIFAELGIPSEMLCVDCDCLKD